jgi:hypothetical protein
MGNKFNSVDFGVAVKSINFLLQRVNIILNLELLFDWFQLLNSCT